MACSIFITDEGGCAPIYIDIAVYIAIAIGLLVFYALMKKVIKHLKSIKG